jgi:hypothetical protein
MRSRRPASRALAPEKNCAAYQIRISFIKPQQSSKRTAEDER